MDLGGALPYHPPITQPSPTGQPQPDQEALTCDFMPALDWRRRPWTVSTTCAMWDRIAPPPSGPVHYQQWATAAGLPDRAPTAGGHKALQRSRHPPSPDNQSPTPEHRPATKTLQQAIATIAFFQDHRIAATRPVIIPRLRRVSGPQHPCGPSKTAMRAEVSRVISLAACPLLPTKPSRYNTPHYHQDPDHTRANSPH